MTQLLAYVDPGSGFVFLQQAPILWLIILSAFGFLAFFIKIFLKFIKNFLWLFILLTVILTVMGIYMNQASTKKKIIVLGIDAMDPAVTEKLMNEGRLPNLSYLKKEGSYSKLGTSNPAESVVAWTNFATGMNPGNHGIFDFIMRDPLTYMPYLSLNEISDTGNARVSNRRKADAFWDYLSKHKVPSFIFFCPNTFPAEKLRGKMLSGMGTPDLYGTMGRFSFYTTQILPEEKIKDTRGKIICVKIKNSAIEAAIYGPRIKTGNSIAEAEIPLKITLKPGQESAQIEFQKTQLYLKKGAWSKWQKIYFKSGPFKKLHGIIKFYLKNTEPDFELYISPVNFDPENPAFPISYPENYSRILAKKIGPYYTQGMPHDTWALSEELLDEKTFLEQVDMVMDERKSILLEELEDFKKGLFFFYIDTLDVVQHMFWQSSKGTIYSYYEKIDDTIGAVLKKLDKDTTLIILSDHGFNSFYRTVHLNRWLLENGFLALKQGKNQSGEFFKDIDWPRTKAYALGFGGIYLNKKGRESQGIVSTQEEEHLKNEISAGLKLWIDPLTQKNVIKEIYSSEDIFNGAYKDNAPDLFAGFNAGFRASWQTALGATPEALIEDNKKKWSGDHLIDPSLVPGVLFINRKVKLTEPSIVDLAPTILKSLNTPDYDKMDGKSLCDF